MTAHKRGEQKGKDNGLDYRLHDSYSIPAAVMWMDLDLGHHQHFARASWQPMKRFLAEAGA